MMINLTVCVKKKASKQQQRLKYTFQYDLSDASDVGGRTDTCRNV